MRLKFVIAVITIALLCVLAFAQTTADEWFSKGLGKRQ